MKPEIVLLFLLFTALLGCTQAEKPGTQTYSELDKPYVKPPPAINPEEFELEFTAIGKAGMVTLLFQKDNITKTTQRADDVLEMKSQDISQKEFEELTQAVFANFSSLEEEEYGEFVEGDGPTYVVELVLEGKQKVVSCQMSCPQEIKNIAEKVKSYIEE